MKSLRRLVAILVIAAFSIAALGGIIVLLRGGDISETEGRVLLTTVIVGIEALAMLCYLATADTRAWVVGLLGALISLAAFGWSLAMVWGAETADDEWKLFFSLLILAGSLAQASLLLGLAGRFRTLVGITMILVGAVAAMAVYAIFAEVTDDTYFRVHGIFGILDALGTVVAIAAAAVRGRGEPAALVDAEPAPAAQETPLGTWSLTPTNEQRLVAVAHANGMSPNEFVEKVLEAFSGDDAGDREA